jgi:CheY-like chemotaxis protein
MLNPTLFQSVPASVLVIEDSMDVADSLARFLRVGTGHDVRVAYDGLSGIRMAVAEVPEAVVCDIAMPKVDGLTVARELAELTPRPLLIAVTGFSGQIPEAEAKAAGFDFYLVKPADPLAIDALIQARRRAGE